MVDFQDVLLDDEEIHGINIKKRPATGKKLTLEEAKEALKKLIEAFKEEENAKWMNEYFERAKQNCGDDLATGMNFVREVGFEVQMRVLPSLGFEESYAGLVDLASAIREHQNDLEVLRLKQLLASNFIPPKFRLNFPPPQ